MATSANGRTGVSKISRNRLAREFQEGDPIEMVVELYDRCGEVRIRGRIHTANQNTFRVDTETESYLLKHSVCGSTAYLDGLVCSGEGRVAEIKSISKPVFEHA